jgi:hypothetical protein
VRWPQAELQVQIATVLKEPINLSDEEKRLFTTKPKEVTA